MAKLAVYKYFSFMILVITVMTATFTLFGLFGGNANPVHETAMAMIVYVLPLFVIGNVITLIFWLIRRRWHWAAIPFVTLLCSIPYIGTLYQVNIFASAQEEQSGFKIASYNVAVFGRETTGFKAEDILTVMKQQQVDILCLQEYAENSGDKNNTESYKGFYTSMAKGRDDMVIFSRFPIKKSQIIDFGNTNNSGMWADIDIKGKILRVFNIHLETTGFNRTLHKAAKQELKGKPVESNALLSSLFGDYTRGMVVRAGQANIVAEEINNSNRPVIVCGDFNDVPYSYAYNTVKGDLVDGFVECGKGYMSTMRGKKSVRIDYIFHDKNLEGLSYYKLNVSYSDHDPVFMKIAF